ncbi:uncharacterized protein SAPINGB_P005209 [Magnusiomyces paraingens]|uniref:Mitochondrial aspartate-glutamate transporter AGC1 n=1 Tax=Magnusiomyces paraingens TaxID=2606893 RepID=A0A5E8C633_9ASCO|nr:uncharacterized protein SAPINGB_P005209 [Saprochaete ingens]VVT56676.1 unnamed protein product [Saprochaete ingens]
MSFVPPDSLDVFQKYASITSPTGEKFLSHSDFVDAIAPLDQDYHKIPREAYALLFKVADRSNSKQLSLDDWTAFEKLLYLPDAEYQIAFRLFQSPENPEVVEFADFVNTYNKIHSKPSSPEDFPPFDWNSAWSSLYLGDSTHRHNLSYNDFSQLIAGVLGERVRQAFSYYDPSHTGYILPDQLQTILETTASHKLSDTLLKDAKFLCNVGVGPSSKISYAHVRAFLNVINRADLVEVIIRNAAKSIHHSRDADTFITRQDFLNQSSKSARFALFTPLEIDVIFHFAASAANSSSSDLISLNNFKSVFDPTWQERLEAWRKNEAHKIEAAQQAFVHPTSFLHEVFESAYNFALGAVAGAFGATVVYPIDLVKTRMQNQRSSHPGQQLLYKNSIDCFKKVVSREGVLGLYSGLGPQLIGVAPEKAIKLTVNDLIRGKFASKDGSIPVWAEILAGGTAGACQVVFTNPLEIVKIRLQMQGEVAKTMENAPKRSALWIVRNLGLFGLYKGASACLLRDVPFSAIYFPTYAHLKKDYFGEGPNKSLSILQLLTAGAIAGMPAAYFTTPFDVIKTRLQTEAKAGQSSYFGLRHAAVTIWKEEGFKAFFKGGPARILRSSPQFGCTLAAYELLHDLFPLPGHSKDKKTEAGHSVVSGEISAPFRFLQSKSAMKVILDIDHNFGKPGALTEERKKLIPGLK